MRTAARQWLLVGMVALGCGTGCEQTATLGGASEVEENLSDAETGDSDASGEGWLIDGIERVEAQDYWRVWLETMCQAAWRCGPSPEIAFENRGLLEMQRFDSEAACIAYVRALTPDSALALQYQSYLTASVRRGAVRVQPTLVQRCLLQWRDATCDIGYAKDLYMERAVAGDPDDYLGPCTEMIEPLQQEGDPCTSPRECAGEHRSCDQSAEAEIETPSGNGSSSYRSVGCGQCVRYTSSRDRCGNGPGCGTGKYCWQEPLEPECRPLGQEGDSCEGGQTCDESRLSCGPANTCIALRSVAEGAPCRRHIQCQGALICANGLCTEARPHKVGEPCHETNICEVGSICLGGRCEPVVGAGSPCVDTDHCLMGLFCDTRSEGAQHGTCQPSRQEGHPCAAREECASEFCGRAEGEAEFRCYPPAQSLRSCEP